jgi:hypothetical protein
MIPSRDQFKLSLSLFVDPGEIPAVVQANRQSALRAARCQAVLPHALVASTSALRSNGSLTTPTLPGQAASVSNPAPSSVQDSSRGSSSSIRLTVHTTSIQIPKYDGPALWAHGWPWRGTSIDHPVKGQVRNAHMEAYKAHNLYLYIVDK